MKKLFLSIFFLFSIVVSFAQEPLYFDLRFCSPFKGAVKTFKNTSYFIDLKKSRQRIIDVQASPCFYSYNLEGVINKVAISEPKYYFDEDSFGLKHLKIIKDNNGYIKEVSYSDYYFIYSFEYYKSKYLKSNSISFLFSIEDNWYFKATSFYKDNKRRGRSDSDFSEPFKTEKYNSYDSINYDLIDSVYYLYNKRNLLIKTISKTVNNGSSKTETINKVDYIYDEQDRVKKKTTTLKYVTNVEKYEYNDSNLKKTSVYKINHTGYEVLIAEMNYFYDSKGNWIKKEVTNHLSKDGLIHVFERRFEYYD